MAHHANASFSAPSERPVRQRMAWDQPRVIVSDLSNARSGSMQPGADASNPTYGTPYGS